MQHPALNAPLEKIPQTLLLNVRHVQQGATATVEAQSVLHAHLVIINIKLVKVHAQNVRSANSMTTMTQTNNAQSVLQDSIRTKMLNIRVRTVQRVGNRGLRAPVVAQNAVWGHTMQQRTRLTTVKQPHA
jgi:hypothetical protein